MNYPCSSSMRFRKIPFLKDKDPHYSTNIENNPILSILTGKILL